MKKKIAVKSEVEIRCVLRDPVGFSIPRGNVYFIKRLRGRGFGANLANMSTYPKQWWAMAAKIGAAILHLRRERGWNLHEAQDATGVAYSNLSRYERGERLIGLFTLAKVAQGYGTTLTAILRRAKV